RIIRNQAVTADNETTWTEAAPKDRRAFSASEMFECAACARTNPPTRSNCLYCGAAIETSAATSLVALSPALPDPEPGKFFHVVARNYNVGEAALAERSQTSQLEIGGQEFVFSGKGAPFCTVNDSVRAETICARLRTLGVEATTVDDEQLNLDASPKDLRTLEFTADSLVAVGRRES